MSVTNRSHRRLGEVLRAPFRRQRSHSPNQPPNSAVQAQSDSTSTAGAAQPQPDRLHQKAFQEFQLSHSEDAKLLENYIDPTRSVKWHEEAAKSLDDELANAKANRLRVKFLDGKVLIVSEVLGKLTDWVQKMIEVGDVAVQFDPVHAALPWAAFRFILKVVVSYKEAEAAVWEGIERVCHDLAWVNMHEKLYLRSKPQEDSLLEKAPEKALKKALEEALEKALIAFYVQIFTMLVKYLKQLKTPRSTLCIRSPFLSKSDFRQCITSMDHKKNSVEEILGQVMRETQLEQSSGIRLLLEAINSLNISASRSHDINEKMYKCLEAKEQTNILDWISSIPYPTHFAQARTKILLGTGQWLFAEPQFQEWKSSDKSEILRIHGKSGSGKSTLLSIVLDRMQEESEGNGSPFPVYFYCARTSAEPYRAEPVQILRCLLRQLAELSDGRIHQSICQRYSERNRKGSLEGGDEIIELCTKSIESRGRTIILVDALDESDPVSRDILLCGLARLVKESTRLVKIFLTSRDDRLEETILDYPELVILPQNNANDIETYLESELNRMEKDKLILGGQLPSDLRNHIKNELLQKANGMFRWVALQLQALKLTRDKEAMRERVGKLDVDLTKSYRDLFDFEVKHLEDRSPKERDVTLRTFKWLMVAQTQLPSNDFCILVGHVVDTTNTPKSTENLIKNCFSLVEYDAATDSFRFCHLSVREFFESASFRKAYPEFEEPAMHAMAAARCLSFVESDEDFFSKFYDAIYWQVHVYEAGAEQRMTGDLKEKLNRMLDDQSGMFVAWKSSLAEKLEITNTEYSSEIQIPRLLHPLMIAAMWDIHERVFELCQGKNIDSLKEICRNDSYDKDGWVGPFQLAAIQGHTRVLEALLETGIDADSFTREKEIALTQAVSRGNEHVTRYLLKKIGRAYRQEHLNDLLFVAVLKVKLVPLLLDHGADIKARDRFRRTVLSIAALLDYDDCVRLLIKRGADTSARDSDGKDALWMACSVGCEKALSALLEQNADIDTRSNDKTSALMVAAERGHSNVVRLLLAAGVNTGALDQNGKSALCLAVKNQQSGIVSMLLDHRQAAGRETAEKEVCSVLNTAAEAGRGCAKLIRHIRTRLDVPPDFHFDRKALDAGLISAVEEGIPNDVDYLIKRGANVHPLDKAGKVIGLIAVTLEAYFDRRPRDQKSKIAELLIRAGADINAERPRRFRETDSHTDDGHDTENHFYNSEGRALCALALAAKAGDYNIVKLLLEGGIKPTKRQKVLDCALLHAAKCSDSSIVELLLTQGAAVNALFSLAETGSPLAAAAESGHVHVVNLLLEKGAKVDLCSKISSTAFVAACKGSHSKITKLLLSRGADPYFSTTGYAYIFSNAAKSGDAKTIEMLLKQGISIDTAAKEHATALTLCCNEGDVEAVRMLLRYNADTNIAGGSNGNTLITAIRYGSSEIVEMLLDHGADPNLVGKDETHDRPETPLICALGKEDIGVMQMLLDHGADVNMLVGGISVLAVAIILEDTDALDLLLEHGADIHLGINFSIEEVTFMASNMLSLAVLYDNQYAVKSFLEHGADIHLSANFRIDDDAITAKNMLSLAVQCGNLCAVKSFLERGANPSSVDMFAGLSCGWFPIELYEYKFEDRMSILRLICRHRASLTINFLGRNVLDRATQLLEDVEAQIDQENMEERKRKSLLKRFYRGAIVTLRVLGAEHSEGFLRRQERRMERKLAEDFYIDDLDRFFDMTCS